MREHLHGEIRTTARKFSAAQIIPVYRRGTPYTRLMQIHYSLRTSRDIAGKNYEQITIAWTSLVSTGICQWALMRNYWGYSGPDHERMTVRRLPLRTAIKIEVAGRILYPISRARHYLTFTAPNAVRRWAYQHNPVRLLRERSERKAWDKFCNQWLSK